MQAAPLDWKQYKLKDLSKHITAGATPSTKVIEYWNEGNIPWMSSGEVNYRFIEKTEKFITEKGYKNSSTSLIPKKSILMALAGQGKTRGKVAVNNIELTTNQSLAAIIPNEKLYYLFLFYYLEKKYDDLRKLSSGEGGRGGLNLKIISSLMIDLPPYEEQKKIANILTTWDRAIELKNKEVDNSIKMKKAIVQGLFNKENLKQFKMKDLVSETRAKSTGLEEVYSVSVHKGVINQIEHLGRNYAADNTDNYNLVSFGDIVYTKSPTGEFPYGIIKQSTQATDVIVSPLYGVFKPISYNTGIIMDAYFESYINTGNYLKPIIQKGAKNTINITNSTFLEGKILFPKEKNLIDKYAQLIVNLDYKIDLLKQELKLLTKQKQGLMQQLLTGKVRVQS